MATAVSQGEAEPGIQKAGNSKRVALLWLATVPDQLLPAS